MRKSNSGLFALLVVGGFYLWRNRFEVQRFLAENGINLPLDTSNISNTIKSGTAKVVGNVQHAAHVTSDSLSSASKETRAS